MSSIWLLFSPKKRKLPNQEARNVLDKARYLIESKGWTQGYLSRSDDNGLICGYCIMGALRQAAIELDSWEYCSAYRYILNKIGGNDRIEIEVYNDNPSRTKEQVLALFD